MAEIIHFNKPLSLGQKVRICRVAYCLTQEELSSLANTTQAQVSALERDLFVYPAAKHRILASLGINKEEMEKSKGA
ncbi:hypothetical protein ACFLXH_00945 [Chloroflexota bacterium]